ncbi:MAG: HD domain-containing protein [Syntrophomonadaceae bacterium]|nr:HD domain-containing protein [Syntrophomonadaceae bacterium]MDD3023300.1 HD domain-containing protein [Syntrophomonadaceae bacterium]
MIDIEFFRDLDLENLLLLVPELVETVGCKQNHPGHNWDVFIHTIKVVEQVPMDLTLKLAALLHDIGKPESKVIGEDGFDHFWGHEEIGAQKAESILKRLNIDESQMNAILVLVRLHDTKIGSNLSEMERAIHKYGKNFIGKLLVLQQADLICHSEDYCARKLPKWQEIYDLYQTALEL